MASCLTIHNPHGVINPSPTLQSQSQHNDHIIAIIDQICVQKDLRPYALVYWHLYDNENLHLLSRMRRQHLPQKCPISTLLHLESTIRNAADKEHLRQRLACKKKAPRNWFLATPLSRRCQPTHHVATCYDSQQQSIVESRPQAHTHNTSKDEARDGESCITLTTPKRCHRHPSPSSISNTSPKQSLIVVLQSPLLQKHVQTPPSPCAYMPSPPSTPPTPCRPLVINPHSQNGFAQALPQEKQQQRRKQRTQPIQFRSTPQSKMSPASIQKQKPARKSSKSRTLMVRLCLRKEEAMAGRDKFSDDGNNIVAEEGVLRTAALGLRARSTNLKYR